MKKNYFSKKIYITALIALIVFMTFSIGGFVISAQETKSDVRGLPFTYEDGGTFKFPRAEEPFPTDIKEISFEYKINGSGNIRFMIGSWSAYYGYFIFNESGSGNSYSGVTTELLSDGYVKVILRPSEITNYEIAKPSDSDELSMLYLNANYSSGYVDNFRYELIDEPMIIDGAGIKLSEPYGIMFEAFVPLSSYDPSATYGMMIVPSYVLTENNITGNYYANLRTVMGDELIDNALSLRQLNENDKDYEKYGEGYVAYTRLKGVSSADVNRKYSAIGYKKKGSVYTYFNMHEDGRSIAEIAKIAYEQKRSEYSAESIQLLKDVLNCAGFTFNGDELEPYVLRSSGIRVNAVKNSEQVTKNAAYTAEPVEKVEFYAAKGERETAQLILYMNQSYYGVPFTVRFSDLKNGSSVISGDTIETYVQLYQHVDSNWSKTSEQPGSWYPTGYADSLPTGWYPDALLPYETAVSCNKNVLDSTNGKNQGLFFITHIPSDASAGQYSGQVFITVGEKEVLCLPVEINVYDFVMPENESKAIIRIVTDEIKSLYGAGKYYTSGEIYNELFDFIAERGISSELPSEDLSSRKNLASNIEIMKSYAQDERIGAYLLPYTQENCSLTVSYKVKKLFTTKTETVSISDAFIRNEDKVVDGIEYIGMKTVLTAMVEASTNECDLFKKAVIYNPQADEPGVDEDYIQNIILTETINDLKQYILDNCDFTGKSKVRESVANLQYMVVGTPYSEMVNGYDSLKVSSVDDNCVYCGITVNKSLGVVDCFCPLYSDFYRSAYQSTISSLKSNSAKTLWWYGSIQPCAPYASFNTNAPMIRMRVNRWQQFGLGVEGDFYYKCNRTRFVSDDTVYSARTEAEILNGLTYEGAYGDGVLIYTVYNTYGKYSSVRKQAQVNVLSTLRMENYAEGNDDYNYLVYAQKLIDALTNSSTKSAYQTRLNNILSTLYTSPADNTRNPDILFAARSNLANIITELS